jgi:Protein of unknown function (DUF3455)
MKKTISKNIGGMMLIAGFVLVMTSCQKELGKEQNATETNVSHAVFNPSLNDGNETLFPSVCTGTIPQILNVPEGNKLALQTFARGFQIYEVKRSATDPTIFSWVNIAPLATLYLHPDFTNEVIHHFAGPTWEFIKGTEKGEKVVATKVQGITPDATAIQWLTLKTVDSLSTPGNKVTFVQRICTVGGLAPATGADEAHLGQLDSIPYTASYLFYIKN